MEIKCAGCEKGKTPAVAGKNVHEVLVTLGIVNSGKKKLVAGRMGMQSTLMLPPMNETFGDESASMSGETSRTVTFWDNFMLKTRGLFVP